jgi:dihydroorotate dehydrogenase
MTRMRLTTKPETEQPLPDLDMSTHLGELPLVNPILTASGCAAAGRELDQFFDITTIGGIVTKSVMQNHAQQQHEPVRHECEPVSWGRGRSPCQ